jgi:hypothetical protein
VRATITDELRRLEHRPATEQEQRDVLDDLASRLEAMVRHLRTLGLDATELSAVLEFLRDMTVPTGERWAHAQRALRHLLDGRQSGCWKRG